ncbi:MAG: DsbE family thiol:disulfide interchange protein [Gammaproteobacteria bacterium]|nr:DsbE family thiol:disulfide interchange protein [Gammaproteobacteria bacterium]NIR85967.1 DsbE family thiol:disulfide interchange protein [Gammaproteobacteria bacterium]NIR91958.1 DsbE family thiol:disulfide interchange protein [Gammaproteobacteria bacterium]NIU07208.1 DsbE family thiol:disulfide interchange protein [Gammaproteobacteria bacterium]NIV74209.1 DsbE family thiol:disulfide interchange protein [Gammaproteobacteria bacterium]
MSHRDSAAGEPVSTPGATRERSQGTRRLGLIVPVVILGVLVAVLGVGLTRDPSLVPSPLIGKPVPEFDLPPVEGRSLGLSSADLRGGEVSLVNVFASWCTACRWEHPLLMALEDEGVVPVHGLNYKDAPEDAAAWLDTLGDPYTRTGADLDGRVGIEWGVYGVPETFVVDGEGRIAYKHIGPIDERALQERILPLIERLRQE